jgi:hypothetical protein
MIKIGFVILSHSLPSQLLRLSKRLSLLFDEPPIVCHHDFSKCSLDTSSFPRNMQFVQPSIATKWGGMSVVSAALSAFRLLMNRAQPPDWFYLLSTSDYPVCSPELIRADLENAKHDVYMEIRRISYELAKSPIENDNTRRWVRIAYDRYCAVPMPLIGRFIRIRNPALQGPFRFFDENFRCYGGEHWFTANRKAVEWLLSEQPIHKRLQKQYAKRPCVDESYYHCVFGNNQGLRICGENKRFIDWTSPTKGPKHPRTLSTADLPAILASKAHFARKFQPNSVVLDEIDKYFAVHV